MILFASFDAFWLLIRKFFQSFHKISVEKEAANFSIKMTPLQEENPLLPSYIKSYTKTGIQMNTFDCIWSIDNFVRVADTVDKLCSSPFPEEGHNLIQMIAKRKDGQLITRFYIRTDTEYTGSCTTTLMNASGQVLSSRSISGCISDMTLLIKITNNIQVYKDMLKIHCKFEFFDKLIHNTIHMNLPSPIVFSDVTSLENSTVELESENWKSVKFMIAGEQFVVSTKLLRATKSSYFENICLSHLGKVIDMASELTRDEEFIFKEMLLFIISGSIGQHDYNTLKELLKAAEIYDVQTLKLICEHYLLRHITVKNALKLLELAVKYNAKCLKTHSAKFINLYMEEILDTKGYQKFAQFKYNSNKIIELIEKSEILQTSNESFSSSSVTETVSQD